MNKEINKTTISRVLLMNKRLEKQKLRNREEASRLAHNQEIIGSNPISATSQRNS